MAFQSLELVRFIMFFKEVSYADRGYTNVTLDKEWRGKNGCCFILC